MLQQDSLFERIRNHAKKKIYFSKPVERQERIEAYQSFLRLEEEMLKRYHRKDNSGRRVAMARSVSIDVLMENLMQYALMVLKSGKKKLPCDVALLATGGYGRSELCPQSDIDFMFLFPNRVKESSIKVVEQTLVEEIIYCLWDLNVIVGDRSLRTIDQCIEQSQEDPRVENSLMDARFINGSKSLFNKFSKSFVKFYTKDRVELYFDSQMASTLERHAKNGNSVYMQAPDVKNGKGSLRDYHHTRWMYKVSKGPTTMKTLSKDKLLNQSQQRSLRNSYNYLLRVRNALHFYHNKPIDVLELEQQPKIALTLGFTQRDIGARVRAFMKEYYRNANNLWHYCEYVQRRLHQQVLNKKRILSFRQSILSRSARPAVRFDGFVLEEGLIDVANRNVFKEDPRRLIRIFRYRQQYNARFHFGLYSLIEDSLNLLNPNLLQDESVVKSFFTLLSEAGNLYDPISKMHDLGILSRIIPTFKKIRGLVQHEYYHLYTVDKHTLYTLKYLDAIVVDPNPLQKKYQEEFNKLDHPEDLTLILLLHDIGKAYGIRGHALKSANLSKPILRNFGLTRERNDRILFLVEYHAEMSRFAQKYDIDDPETYQSFAVFIKDAMTLRFLFIITYCDAMATTPELWNSFKDILHTTLFQRCLGEMSQEKEKAVDLEAIKAKAYQHVMASSLEGVEEDEIVAHFSFMPKRYFLGYSPQEITRHITLIHQLLLNMMSDDEDQRGDSVIHWKNDLEKGFTVVTVLNWDRSGLFSKTAGAFSLSSLSILSAQVLTREDHISVDTYYVTDSRGGIVEDKKIQEVFRKNLAKNLRDSQDLDKDINKKIENENKQAAYRISHQSAIPRPRTVQIYHEISLKRTIIEVQTKDQIGLLYFITKTIYQHGFNITFARISTIQRFAIDTFYIENIVRNLDTDAQKLNELQLALEQLIQKQ